jgi:hypothetical protein
VSTIFETINAAGTSTAFMRADGAISGTSIYGTGLTATTISATTYLNIPSSSFSGGTVSGPTNFTNGLSANTISATTYFNLPSSSFTGGTVDGATTFTNGLSANTISATTITGNTIFSGSSDISTLFTPLSNYRASGATFSSFTGTPLSLQVTFSSNFADTNYAVIITGQDERSFYITNKLVSGFTINTGSNTALTGNVDWIAFRYR